METILQEVQTALVGQSLIFTGFESSEIHNSVSFLNEGLKVTVLRRNEEWNFLISDEERTIFSGTFTKLSELVVQIEVEVQNWENHCRIDLMLTMQAYDFEHGTFAVTELAFI
jgi:hypothetical protein